MREVNIGESLVSIGFATVIDKPLKTDDKYVAYYNGLKQAEAYALRKKLGIKYYIKPTKQAILTIAKKISKLLNDTTKQKTVNLSKVAVT